ncbi:spectrin beta chain, non-erythrocytic 2 isoform X1 [Patella vulgata]|uniref:spectrin beta chain, non-erythrocytic 2 isoform X1 n=1 Tax=Patella vulgata TaxID=6465 RepID=UPI0024A9F12E|nr:spectrin beta chain, non-erythrocytic 2 isoform X1 [Patella vulgata]
MSLKETQQFEKGRIKVLQDERVYIQKKTFTKWANAFLEKARMEIKDLFTDLSDGKMLMKLLEIISGENLGKPNKGVLRVQKVENLNRCLKFLATKVYFENIGAEDILDGNQRLILGLIWTIILRFQIQEIVLEDDEDKGEKRSAKDALLLWCQRKTEGYPGVKITNFTTSWRNGLGFNALIHAHRPDVIDYEKLEPADHIGNLNNAFNVADSQLGIPRILDAEDVDVNRPDEKVILTYVASYYHYFAKMKSEMTGGKRIAKVLGNMVEVDKMQQEYENLMSNLLEWIQQKINSLNNRNFPNALEGIQKELLMFKEYMTVEKPPKYRERGNIEAQYFNIQARLKANGQKLYIPKEGHLIHDIETAWLHLEKCEHGREVALRDELIRQERLEQLARRFARKAGIREAWLKDMEQILDEEIICSNAVQTEAAVKKHEAISAEILARKDRFRALNNLASELVQGNYHNKDSVQKKDQEVMRRWRALLDTLEGRKVTLSGFSNLMSHFREIESIEEELKEVEGKVKLTDYGKHLQATEDYIEQHSLHESQLQALAKRVRNLNRRSKQYGDEGHPEAKPLEKRLNSLNDSVERVKNLSKVRKNGLEVAKSYYQFMDDSEMDERWVTEKLEDVRSNNTGKDLDSALKLLKKHENLELEMATRWKRCEQLCAVGQDLVNSGHQSRSEIGQRIKTMMDKWKQLQEQAKLRRVRLEDAIEAHQYYADANEAEWWMREKMPIVTSDDYGKDAASAQALLSRHNRLEKDIKSFNTEIKRLEELSVLMTKASTEHNISPAKFSLPAENGEKSDEEEFGEEVIEVPQEVEVERVVEQEVLQDVVETRKIPQVKAMYAYKGQDTKVDKGEIMILLQQTNEDWWQVRQTDGTESFVPANYVKPVEPKVIQKVVKRPVKVPKRVKVKETVMKKEVVKQKKSAKVRRAPSVRSQANLHFDKDNVETRQRGITVLYNKLSKLAKARSDSLADAIRLFQFYRECDEFDIWMTEKEKVLTKKESLADNVDAVRNEFKNLLTSFAANKGRLDDINSLAGAIVNSGSGQSKKVQARQKEINDRWAQLNKLKQEKEKSLQGASSIELFNSTCDELQEWIKEKDYAISTDDIGKDLRSIEAQQRRHANLERELASMESQMNTVCSLGDTVKTTYPAEGKYVDQRLKDLTALWRGLKEKEKARKKKLNEAQNQLKFAEEAKDLLSWSGAVRARLASAEMPHDIKSAERMLKENGELADDIAAYKDKFAKIRVLGNEVLAKDPNARDVKEKMERLAAEERLINDLWKQRQKQLQDAYDQQVFNRDADKIDAITRGHEAFLDFNDLGSTVDDVEGLLRRHEEFENKLQAQDEKVRGLNDMAEKLIAEKHPNQQHIKDRNKEVKNRREGVKVKAADRRKALLDALAFHQFKRGSQELSDWMKDKYKTATDESYRDLSNLQKKLQKHQAFEAELKANSDRLQSLNQSGDGMIKDKHYASPEIKTIMGKLNSEWDDLSSKAAEKGNKLREAGQQQALNQALEDAQDKLNEMEKSNANKDLGSDLRGVKELLKKHQNLENDLSGLSKTIQGLNKEGKEMADKGHFNSANIMKSVDGFNSRFNKLKPEVEERKSQLQESLQRHQFNFDVENELSWIKEHLPAASSVDYGKNLIDAQKLHKKHQDLDREIQGHQPNIERVLATGEKLLEDKHVDSKKIKDKSQELQLSWDDLLKKSKLRKKNLDISVQQQKYLSEVAEVDSWISEKTLLASSTDYGKDEDAADKLLAKNKVLETDIQTYQGIVNGLGKESSRLFKMGCADPSFIKKTQDQLQESLNKLKRLVTERTKNLERSVHLHEYMREADDLEDWIGEQIQTASSEEYGQDFEHFEILRGKFDEFKLRIETGGERIKRCERLSKALLEDKGPHTIQVQQRQEQLKDSWNALMEQIRSRNQKLKGAEEIHRFNRDVEDALSRIQEKHDSIPDDVGRDFNATSAYLKKHEAFENELVALEAQLQVLIDDSGRLQVAYPGENAEQIEQFQATVVDRWGQLQERSEQRKGQLLAAADLHKFRASVRDLVGWAKEIEDEMKTEHTIRDVHSVDMLRNRHDQIRAEIEARGDTFDDIIKTGNDMIQHKHYASPEIKEKIEQVGDVKDRLLSTWMERKAYYDQLCDLHIFLRDANQLETISSSQEAYLTNADLGADIYQVESLKRKHDAFEKVIEAQDEKLAALTDHGTQLVKENHIQSETVQKTMAAVKDRRSQVKNRSEQRKQQLADNLLYAKFNQDAAEAEGWIDDKLKVAYEDDFQNSTDLHDKMKKLQKHQAFESEIVANKDRINKIKQNGELLIKKKHSASPEIKKVGDRLGSKWGELLKASSNRGRGLEEAKDILEFNEQVQKVEAWIRDKELLVNAGELGRDYEHCLELQKKANNIESAGITVDESRIKSINDLADRLISQGRTDTETVKRKRDEMNKAWKALQGNLTKYKQQLSTSLEIHSFNRDINDINERINEKAILLSVEDLGKDLAGVEALQRKQEDIERDMTALQNQLEKVEVQAGKLCNRYRDKTDMINQKKQEVDDNWERLEDLSDQRKAKLAESYQLQKFLSDARELSSWSNEMIARMNGGELAKDVAEAENCLQMHHERKAEINGRKSHFSSIRECGMNLINNKHYASEEIQKMISQLDKTKLSLNGTWDKHNNLLTQCHDLMVFKETAEQCDTWLGTKEAFLANEDLGNTLYSVEGLIKKHEGFEKTTKAQEDRIEDLKQFGDDLCEKEHYAKDEIKKRCQSVLSRRVHMWELSTQRRKKLQESHNYQIFLRNLYEVSGWINEKLQVALDESYRDPTNLQAKLQKHQAFEAELAANRNRVDAVVQEGQGLLDGNHYSQTDIKKRLEELERSWQALIAASGDKKDKLQDAYQALLFNRAADDLMSWMDEVENQLMSEDHGKDLSSVNNLLKKHQQLEQDISNHQEKIQDILDAVQVFKEAKHFLKIDLQARSKEVSERYQSLNEPCHIRRDNLEEALRMYQFYRDVDDELSWIQDKQPTASNTDLGNSLTGVQNLMKKHQALESEIIAHEPLIDAVASSAQMMVRSKHFASQDIQNRLDNLHKQLQELKQTTSSRKLKLQASLEAQKFYTEVAETESWMNEKIPQLTSSDLGKDEDSVQALMKKLDALERDVDNFSNSIGELSALSRSLTDKGHYDSENIKQKQADIEQRYSQLQDLTNQRRVKLNDSKKLFEFYREADEVSDWIEDKSVIAGSEDYGQDLEHIEILQQKFEDFIHDLNSKEDRVTKVVTMGKTMIDNNHFEKTKIQKRSDEITQMWNELKEVAQARQESLVGAKEVHMYGREADDTLEWIQEKDLIVSSDDFGHDLESVQSLISRHEGLERDLAAISEQVEIITKEAERLMVLYPDAQEHIARKHEEMVHAWNTLVEKSSQRKEKLQSALQLQMYFNDYRELTAWISEMIAIITSDELARDLPGAESMITRYKEHKVEVDSRAEAFTKFQHTGELLIKNGHFLSEEIQEKITQLNGSREGLIRTMNHRRSLHEQNLEAQKLKYYMEQLDAWMSLREPHLRGKNYGDSIQGVEELLRRHADFEKTVDAQEPKFQALDKPSEVEKAFAQHRLQEQQQQVQDEAKRERERLDDLRRKEQDRILDERKKEEDQRKAREISLRRQREGSSENEEDRGQDDGQLDRSVVKNLIVARSQSIKMAGRPENNMSVRQDQSLSPLTKATEFTFSGSVDDEDLDIQKPHDASVEEEGDVPSLPSLPPPPKSTNQRDDLNTSSEMINNTPSPASPGISKKEKLTSPPLSPKQKRVDNLKDEKKSKRTPSFNIRRKTRSFKKEYKLPETLPPVAMEGTLDRKLELQSGGKKATIRSWKQFYTVMFGQLLCFFKDKEAISESKQAAAPPVNIHQASCEIAKDYTKKKNVLRVKTADGAEFLLEIHNEEELNDWLNKITYHAEQPPMFPALELYQNSSELDESVGDAALEPSEQFTKFEGESASPQRSVSPQRTTSPQRDEKQQNRMSIVPEDGVKESEQQKDVTDGKKTPVTSPGAVSSKSDDSSLPVTSPSSQSYISDGQNGDDVQMRSKGGASIRPVSEPVGQFADDGKSDKKKSHSVFGFLKKKKEKDSKDAYKDLKKDRV